MTDAVVFKVAERKWAVAYYNLRGNRTWQVEDPTGGSWRDKDLDRLIETVGDEYLYGRVVVFDRLRDAEDDAEPFYAED